METSLTVAIILIICVIIIYSAIWGGDIPNPYQTRDCMGRKWKKEFPYVRSEDIRQFLQLFTDAFAFKPDQKLKFGPQDKIIDIYCAIYPLKWADALELETLCEEIEKEYSVNFNQVWTESLTLGELFEFVMSAQQGVSPDGNSAGAS